MKIKRTRKEKRAILERAAASVGLEVTSTNIGCMPSRVEDIVSDLEQLAVNMRALGMTDGAMMCPQCGDIIFEVKLVLADEKQ